MLKKRESTIQRNVVAFARQLGTIAAKLQWGEGWPDYIFLYGGRTLFIEFKAPGEKPTKLQAYNHQTLASVGHTVLVVDDIKMGRSVIYKWINHERSVESEAEAPDRPTVRTGTILRGLDVKSWAREDFSSLSGLQAATREQRDS